MALHFQRVAIVGVGLMGASIGMGLKTRGLVDRVTGIGHRQTSLDAAIEAGAIDTGTLDVAEGVREADLVIIATPAGMVIEKLDEVRAAAGPNLIVTDVASTKAAICAYAASTWPQPRRFIGSHPMAGSEKFGPEHGRPDFYEGTVCLVEQDDTVDVGAREVAVSLWTALGATVVNVAPDVHDRLLARTSHIPHVLAAALTTLAQRDGVDQRAIGRGFRDTTRVAGSRPELWRDICLTNREAVLDGIREFQGYLDAFAAALQDGDAQTIEEFFEQGRQARRQVLGE